MTDNYDRETSNKRLKNRGVVTKRIADKDVAIDEADYLVYNTIASGEDGEDMFVIEVDEDDEEKRIFHLTVSYQFDLPKEVGRLSALKYLDCQYGRIPCIPSSICMLKNLEFLGLSHLQLTVLPDEIGLLVSLKQLIIENTPNLTVLPGEIGNLVNLERMAIEKAPIVRLPGSIGNLRKLKKLQLSETLIEELPQEFWNISTLQELVVEDTPVSVPPSIERLKNLESLCVTVAGDLPKEIGNLSRLERLVLILPDCRLPSEIGKLTRLQRFKLVDHDDGYLPPSMANLKNLSELRLEALEIDEFDSNQLEVLKTLPKLEDLSTWPFLSVKQQLDLIRHIPSLIEVTWKNRAPEITQALSLNVYNRQSQNPFASINRRKMPQALRNKLWPQMLDNATRAFKDSRYFMPIDPYDAVHKLLVDGMESFLQVISDRNGRNNSGCHETKEQKVARITRECVKLVENNAEIMSDMFLQDMNNLVEKYGAVRKM